LLHFAGHGTFSQQGWSAGLTLGDGRDLLASDVLAAPVVPDWVVLSGCSTAASRPSMVESIGLAQAFLVAGSAEVVATTRPVEDAVAAQFSAAWHASLARTGDGGVAYRDAVRAVSHEDWSAFRRLVF
jgi:CHAT domain-containing protein